MFRVAQSLFLQKNFAAFDRIAHKSTFGGDPESRLALSVFMTSKVNLRAMFGLAIGAPSGDYLLFFNLVNDALAHEKLSELLIEIKNVYYSDFSFKGAQDRRDRVVELLGFLASELFLVVLSHKYTRPNTQFLRPKCVRLVPNRPRIPRPIFRISSSHRTATCGNQPTDPGLPCSVFSRESRGGHGVDQSQILPAETHPPTGD